jgi:hypothetical protein
VGGRSSSGAGAQVVSNTVEFIPSYSVGHAQDYVEDLRLLANKKSKGGVWDVYTDIPLPASVSGGTLYNANSGTSAAVPVGNLIYFVQSSYTDRYYVDVNILDLNLKTWTSRNVTITNEFSPLVEYYIFVAGGFPYIVVHVLFTTSFSIPTSPRTYVYKIGVFFNTTVVDFIGGLDIGVGVI